MLYLCTIIIIVCISVYCSIFVRLFFKSIFDFISPFIVTFSDIFFLLIIKFNMKIFEWRFRSSINIVKIDINNRIFFLLLYRLPILLIKLFSWRTKLSTITKLIYPQILTFPILTKFWLNRINSMKNIIKIILICWIWTTGNRSAIYWFLIWFMIS